MQTIRFTAELLKGIAHFAATNDTRLYLNGVCVEARHHETRLVATDGHKLGIVRMRIENDITDDITLIVPNSVLRQIQVRAKQGLLADIVIEGENHWLRIPEHDLSYGFKPIDAKYVDYAKTVPRELTGAAACFDPEQLIAFKKCARILTGKDRVPRIVQNGEHAALVTIDGYDDFAGMVMPMKLSREPGPANISWLGAVRLPDQGQIHVNPRHTTRRGNRAALASPR